MESELCTIAHPASAVGASGFGFNSRSSLVCMTSITSQDNGYPLHIPIHGNETHGFARPEQIRALGLNHRGFSYVGSEDDEPTRTVMGTLWGMLELR